MTTDLKAVVEIRRGGTWRLAEPAEIVPVEYFGVPDPVETRAQVTSLPLEQNYELYAIVAGVRNMRWPITPIAEGRGLPPDASPIARALVTETMLCVNWLLASELLEFDWSTRLEGPLVGAPESRTYAELATRTREPDSAPWFREVLPKLRSYGDPTATRVLFYMF
ncbi:MAG: hypothetical protein AAGE52_26620 [Myxococcota bacterium]